MFARLARSLTRGELRAVFLLAVGSRAIALGLPVVVGMSLGSEAYAFLVGLGALTSAFGALLSGPLAGAATLSWSHGGGTKREARRFAWVTLLLDVLVVGATLLSPLLAPFLHGAEGQLAQPFHTFHERPSAEGGVGMGPRTLALCASGVASLELGVRAGAYNGAGWHRAAMAVATGYGLAISLGAAAGLVLGGPKLATWGVVGVSLLSLLLARVALPWPMSGEAPPSRTASGTSQSGEVSSPRAPLLSHAWRACLVGAASSLPTLLLLRLGDRTPSLGPVLAFGLQVQAVQLFLPGAFSGILARRAVGGGSMTKVLLLTSLVTLGVLLGALGVVALVPARAGLELSLPLLLLLGSSTVSSLGAVSTARHVWGATSHGPALAWAAANVLPLLGFLSLQGALAARVAACLLVVGCFLPWRAPPTGLHSTHSRSVT